MIKMKDRLGKPVFFTELLNVYYNSIIGIDLYRKKNKIYIKEDLK